MFFFYCVATHSFSTNSTLPYIIKNKQSSSVQIDVAGHYQIALYEKLQIAVGYTLTAEIVSISQMKVNLKRN